MSVIRMQTSEPKAQSGSGMDRVVEVKGLSKRAKIGLAAAALLLLVLLFWWFAPSANSQSVAADRVTISTVERGRFDDFLPLRARVTPLLTVYLDAVEGGRVEKLYVEDGAMVKKGQLLAELSNSDLQLNVLARQADVSREINSMRNMELALAQTRTNDQRQVIEAQLAADKARRQYRDAAAADGEGLRPGQDVQRQPRRLRIEPPAPTCWPGRGSPTKSSSRASSPSCAPQRVAQPEPHHRPLEPRRAQPARRRSTASSPLSRSRSASRSSAASGSARSTAPAATSSSPRSTNSISAGSSRARSPRSIIGGKTYRAKVAKIYPQVRNGTFQVDLWFLGAEPQDLQRGQTLQVKLTLGDPTPALLIPNGAFYNETGGAFVFVVAPDGGARSSATSASAAATPIISKCSTGSQPGERVITSPIPVSPTRIGSTSIVNKGADLC
jgi:HlyD family secretion protein